MCWFPFYTSCIYEWQILYRGEALEVPGSLDRKDLLFCHKSDKPLGQKQTADTRDAENVPHAQNIKRPNQHLQIKVPEGSSPLQKVCAYTGIYIDM